MQFTDPNVRRTHCLQGRFRLLIFHSQMAGIIIHPQMFGELGIIGMLHSHALEKLDRLRAGFKIPQRLRLQPQMQRFARTITQGSDMFGAFPDVITDDLFLAFIGDKLLKRSRQSTHTALHSIRHQGRNQIEQAVRVQQPIRRSPIRHIHLLFHARTMEIAKGKTVDGKDVTILVRQPLLERIQYGRFTQLASRHVT